MASLQLQHVKTCNTSTVYSYMRKKAIFRIYNSLKNGPSKLRFCELLFTIFDGFPNGPLNKITDFLNKNMYYKGAIHVHISFVSICMVIIFLYVKKAFLRFSMAPKKGPVTFVSKLMYFLYHLDPDKQAYHVCCTFGKIIDFSPFNDISFNLHHTSSNEYLLN